MMSRWIAVFVGCLVGLLAVPLPASAQRDAQGGGMAEREREGAVNLAPRFEVGEVLTYELDIDSRQSIKILGEDKTSLRADMDATIRVETLDPAGVDEEAFGDAERPFAAVELRYTRLAVELEGNRIANGSFDSTTPAGQDDPDDRLAAVGRAIVDHPIVVHLAADGTVTAVRNLESIEPRESLSALLFQRLFSERAFISTVQPMFRVKPAASADDVPMDAAGRARVTARPGERWTLETRSVASLGLPATSLALRLEDRERGGRVGADRHRIAISGEPEFDQPEGVGTLDPRTTAQEISGVAVWSSGVGRLASLDTESRQRMQADGAFTVEIAIESATKLEMTDLRGAGSR